ncbi:MAG TPA: hypothetical protein VHT91_44085, partial [Kofleriaceae bacterium]|nr:hypothetical protein [Kofleriaceae bacterium]
IAGDRLVGHNTDCHGFTDALAGAGLAPRGLRCVLLGAGGAARAVAHGLEAAGAGSIDVLARTPERVAWTAARPWAPDELRAGFARADLVVDTTPVGLADGAADLASVDALPLDALRAGAWVATLVYHRRTRLLERAAAHGHPTLDGRGMLVHQGARAFSIFTGAPPPVEAMQRALDAALAGA